MRGLMFVVLASCNYAPSPGASGTTTDGSTLPDAPMGDAPALGDRVRAIEVVDGQVTGGPHVDFPFLFSTTEPFLRDVANGGEVIRADGFDLYFSADPAGTARLAHEVERYEADDGQLTAWVKVPALDAATVIYLHCGSDTITTSQEDAAGVWSAGYVAVLHLDEETDATGKATSIDIDTVEEVDTPIARGRRFDGVDDRIVVGSPAIDNIFATGGTAEGWFFATGYGENSFGRIWDKGHTNGWSFALDNNVNSLAFVHGDSNQFGEWNGPLDTVSLQSWHYGVVVYDKRDSANLPLLYVDGVELQNINVVDAASGTMDSDAGSQLMAGNRGAGDRTFQGTLDEVRLSNVARSPQWIATQFVNQVAPAAFYTIGEPL